MTIRTMPSDVSRSAAEKLQYLALVLRIQQVRDLAWERLFRPEERRLTGPIEARNLVTTWSKLRKCSISHAIVDLAFGVSLLDVPTRDWLMRELGEKSCEADTQLGHPVWDKQRGELWYHNRIIRRITKVKRATNVIRVLDEFEEAGWPPRLDDPLPNGKDQQRLHATIRSLNCGLHQIVFFADGTGAGYRWRVAD